MKDKGRTITKVGITGAGGRIGRTLTEGLADKYELTLFIRNTQPDTSRNLKIVKADLSKEEEVKGIFEGLDAVIHLAANPSPEAPWENVLQDNIVATYNVLEEVRRAGVKRVIFASTNHVQFGYAKGETIDSLDPSFTESGKLIKLSDPPAPDSYYAVSKLFGEDLGRYYSRLYGLEFISVRIGWAAQKTVSPRLRSMLRREKATEMLFRALFFSQRDSIDLFAKTLKVKADFLVVYGVSNTRNPIFDLTQTKEILSYNPQDNEEEYFQGLPKGALG
ncbi:Uronate dehydrogenase [subsurface metagenome]